jgi:hypothetical protein
MILTNSRTDPDSPRLKELAQNVYDELEMPGDTLLFGHVAIYIRKTNVASEVRQ